MPDADLLLALGPVIRQFETLKVPYYLGGSVASSTYGTSRTTIDVDIVAEVRSEHIEPLAASLENRYYLDRSAIAEAVADRSSFNLIHLDTLLKIDVFPLKDRPYDRVAMQRSRTDTLPAGGPQLSFASPEDVILSKLEWFQLGAGISERQWRDVLGVLKIQAGALDRAYLEHWADQLNLAELLRKAIAEAEI